MTAKSKTKAKTHLEPNLQAAKSFLNALDPEAERFTFQTFKHNENGTGKILHGTLKELAGKLTRLNREEQHGVFITVNQTDFRGRSTSNIQRVRAVFADYDDGPLDDILRCELEPHAIVQSSPGNQHPYWCVDGLDLEEFEPVQKRIQERFNGDAVHDLPRVMRLPGFYHLKDPNDPHLVRILQENPTRPYTAEEVKEAFPPVKNNDRTQDVDSGVSEDYTSEYNGEPFELPDEIPEHGNDVVSGRNMALTRYAGSIWTEDMTRRELLEDLKRVNQNRCKPPMDDEELEKIADSAQRNFDPVPEKQSTGQRIQDLIQNTSRINWPNSRTSETDKAVWWAFVRLAEQANSLTISASVRRLSEVSGVTVSTTKHALDRLQEYGFLKQVSEPDGPNASAFQLTPATIEHYLSKCGRTRSYCSIMAGVSLEDLQDVVFYPDALGRVTRTIVLTLRDYGTVESIGELVELADTSYRTVNRKLEKLKRMEVVKVQQEGRCKQVQLTDDWRDKLDEYRKHVPTRYQDIERKIQHKQEQIMHAKWCEEKEKGQIELKEIPHAQNVELPSPVADWVEHSKDVLKEMRKQEREGEEVNQERVDSKLEQLRSTQEIFTDRMRDLARKLVDYLIEYEERLYNQDQV